MHGSREQDRFLTPGAATPRRARTGSAPPPPGRSPAAGGSDVWLSSSNSSAATARRARCSAPGMSPVPPAARPARAAPQEDSASRVAQPAPNPRKNRGAARPDTTPRRPDQVGPARRGGSTASPPRAPPRSARLGHTGSRIQAEGLRVASRTAPGGRRAAPTGDAAKSARCAGVRPAWRITLRPESSMSASRGWERSG